MMNRSFPCSLLLAFLLAVAGLFAPGAARAQSNADGPFASSADLHDYWDAQFGDQGMHIELEGQTVYSRYGFGPYFFASYFQCSDGLIRRDCPPFGPFRNTDAVIGFWSQFAPTQAAAVYVEGQLVYSRYGFGPAVGAAYVYCPGRGALMSQCSP